MLGTVLLFGVMCGFNPDFVCLYLILAICKRCKMAEFAEDLLMNDA